MPEKSRTYRIFVSAAEPSADAHCAALIATLRKSRYDIEFVGVGGTKMAEAGCRLLENTVTRASMIYNTFPHIVHFYKLIKRITSFLKNDKPDLVIVCDSPAFNFHIAKAAKKAKLKTLFYVAPQLWAWAGWRISKLRRYCDKLCCILPFEQSWFSERGIDTVFVGNPLLDEIDLSTNRYKKGYTDFEPKCARFTLMPGSRAAEINSLWPAMQKIANLLKQKYPNAVFTVAAVDDRAQQALKSKQLVGFECEYVIGSVSDAARNADFAVVASGSATLQVAAAGCPMVIMYQSSKILWRLFGRWIVKTEYLSLVNILSGKELVPEFMPYFSSVEPIAESIEQLLEDRSKLAQISSELIELAKPLMAGGASERVSQIVIEMLC
ncbi:MAG: lipid-A-disaccharide synthase [Planctomycetota bacterium]|nr:MAG: lipid-A-disaccharide synthase [Planctomycetota bacterium]